jgi:hypothetical protein
MTEEMKKTIIISLIMGVPIFVLLAAWIGTELGKSSAKEENVTENDSDLEKDTEKDFEEEVLRRFKQKMCNNLINKINSGWVLPEDSLNAYLGKNPDFTEYSGKMSLKIYLKPNYCNKIIGIRDNPETFGVDKIVEIFKQEWHISNGMHKTAYGYLPLPWKKEYDNPTVGLVWFHPDPDPEKE